MSLHSRGAYTIGPVWSSVIVGTAAALILGFMIFLLVKRPKRQVLEFSAVSGK